MIISQLNPTQRHVEISAIKMPAGRYINKVTIHNQLHLIILIFYLFYSLEHIHKLIIMAQPLDPEQRHVVGFVDVHPNPVIVFYMHGFELV